MTNDSLNFIKLYEELININLPIVPNELRQQLEKSGLILTQKDELYNFAHKLLDVVHLLLNNYPYNRTNINIGLLNANLNVEREEYDDLWAQNIILSSYWKTHKDITLNILSNYQNTYLKLDINKLSSRKTKVNLSNELYYNYRDHIDEFFKRILIVENDIIPKIRSLSYRINLYQNRFSLKKMSILTISIAFSILIIGIFLPLYIHLYCNPPVIKTMELILLLITIITYSGIILYFLKMALGVKYK
jgi:hypothetical protein